MAPLVAVSTARPRDGASQIPSSFAAAPVAKRRRGAPVRVRSSSATRACMEGHRSPGFSCNPRNTILRTQEGTLVRGGGGRTSPLRTEAVRSLKLRPGKGRSP